MKSEQFIKVLAMLTLFTGGCIIDHFNERLSITNKSKRSLSYLYTNLTSRKELTGNNVAAYIADWEVIRPDSIFHTVKPGNQNVWHEYIAKGKTKKLYIYLFDTDTLRKYDGLLDMSEILDQHKYLKMLSYSEVDLNKINWNIIYKE